MHRTFIANYMFDQTYSFFFQNFAKVQQNYEGHAYLKVLAYIYFVIISLFLA